MKHLVPLFALLLFTACQPTTHQGNDVQVFSDAAVISSTPAPGGYLDSSYDPENGRTNYVAELDASETNEVDGHQVRARLLIIMNEDGIMASVHLPEATMTADKNILLAFDGRSPSSFEVTQSEKYPSSNYFSNGTALIYSLRNTTSLAVQLTTNQTGAVVLKFITTNFKFPNL